MGVLRYQGQLDFLIGHFAGRKQPKLDPEVRIALHMGIYQLRYLDRIPPHAAVTESVELVKTAQQAIRRRLRQCGPAQSESRPGKMARSRDGAEPSPLDAGALG